MTARFCVDAGPTENSHRTRGIGWYTRHLLHALTRSAMAARGMQGSYLRRHAFDGERVTDLEWAPRSWTAELSGIRSGTSMRMANWGQLLDSRMSLSRDVIATGADVFLAPDPHAVALSKRFETVAVLYDVIPLVFSAQNLGGRAAPRRWLYHQRLDAIRKSAHIIAISEATRQDAIRLAGFPASRMSVVYPGVDHERFRVVDVDRARAEVTRRFSLDRPFILYVGEADPRKNLPALIDAVHQLSKRNDVVLAIAGAIRGHTLGVRERSDARDPQRNIRWLGYVSIEELAALYASSVALAFPSLYEGFGLPVLEAMSCGTPVVTSPISSLPEVAGDAALYADPNDSAALAATLERLLREPALRAELAGRGIERASRFSWPASAEAILDAAASVASGRGLRGRA